MNVRWKSVAAVLVFALVAHTPLAYAAAIPSKTARGQDEAARQAELVLARNAFDTDRIAKALQAEGLTPEQVEQRLAALSTADVMSLVANPAQVRAAGITMTRRMWTAVGIGAAVLVGALALYNDDDEDSDDSDDGED